MIQIKDLTVKNFMSVGNATQAINFDRQDLTLVLGENLDLGGDGSRNGTGKTTIINALSYALYGEALTNIRRDNLINKTNSKGMLVSLDFCIGEQCYRIERGRKPNVLKFYINDNEQLAEDYAQGDSRETQGAILKLLCMSHTMFKHLVALNTYTEPFLSLKQNDQREIIEQLLGITQLSERADKIKELSKQTRDDIKQEEMTIKALQTANNKIGEQIQALKRRQTLWMNKKAEDIKKFETAIEDLAHVDIDAELASQGDLLTWTELNNTQIQLQKDIAALNAQVSRAEKDVTRTKKALDSLESGTCGSCGQSVDHMETRVLIIWKHINNMWLKHRRNTMGQVISLEKYRKELMHSRQIRKRFQRDQEFFMIACLMHTIIDQLYPHLKHSYKANVQKPILTLIK
jgi:DNA repair exonuclease SbcCD ATPase subunit